MNGNLDYQISLYQNKDIEPLETCRDLRAHIRNLKNEIIDNIKISITTYES